MKQKNRVPLFVEPLEDRWVPATVRLTSGHLFISNPLVTAGSATITVTSTAVNQFKVQDGASNLGTYNVGGNIFINGSNAKDTINFVLAAGKDYTGNLFINSGNGNDTINVVNSSGVTFQNLAGNTNILTGLGNDSVNLSTNTAGGTNAVRFGGQVQVTSQLGIDTINVGNATANFFVGGDLTITNFSTVNLGTKATAANQDFVGGNLNITSTTVNTPVSVTLGSAAQGLLVGKNLNVVTGSGNDSVVLNGTNTNIQNVSQRTIVNGSATLNLGDGNNLFNSAGGIGTTFSGNFHFTSGSGSDTVQTAANTAGTIGNWTVVQGSAQFSLGEGDNNFLTAVGAAGGGDMQVFGDLRVQAGNGNNGLTFGTAGIGGNVSQANGNLFVQLGNGQDSTIINGQVGGQFIYRSGNGNDSLSLGSDAFNYNSNVQFGNGDDTFNLASTGLYSGIHDGGGRLVANVFVQNAGVLSPFFQLSNFP